MSRNDLRCPKCNLDAHVITSANLPGYFASCNDVHACGWRQKRYYASAEQAIIACERSRIRNLIKEHKVTKELDHFVRWNDCVYLILKWLK